MAVLHRLLIGALARAARDPRVQARAGEVYRDTVRPRAAAAWQKAKPQIDAARRDVRDAAAETSPLDDPAGFAANLRRRFAPPRRDDED